MIIEKIINNASEILKKNNIISHELDAQIILSNILKVNKETLITNNENIIPSNVIRKYQTAIERRIKNSLLTPIISERINSASNWCELIFSFLNSFDACLTASSNIILLF